jgi:hypothetical protein
MRESFPRPTWNIRTPETSRESVEILGGPVFPFFQGESEVGLVLSRFLQLASRGVDHRLKGGIGILAARVKNIFSYSAIFYQILAFEQAEAGRDAGLRETENLLQLSHRELLLEEKQHQAQANRI